MSEELDRELRELLDAGAREQVRPGARASIVGGAARRVAWGTWTPWLLLGVLGVGLLAGVSWWPARQPVPEPAVGRAEPAQVAPRPAPPEPPPVRPASLVVERDAPRAAAAPPTPARPPRAERTPPAPEPVEPPPVSTLQQEVALLARAQRALDAGDPGAATAALAEHRRRFPGGVLEADREAATRVARCLIDPAAGPEGLAYASAHPRAPLAERIRRVCRAGGIP